MLLLNLLVVSLHLLTVAYAENFHAGFHSAV